MLRLNKLKRILSLEGSLVKLLIEPNNKRAWTDVRTEKLLFIKISCPYPQNTPKCAED